MDCSMPGFSILHYLLEFAQTHVHWVSDTIQPSLPLSPYLGLFHSQSPWTLFSFFFFWTLFSKTTNVLILGSDIIYVKVICFVHHLWWYRISVVPGCYYWSPKSCFLFLLEIEKYYLHFFLKLTSALWLISANNGTEILWVTSKSQWFPHLCHHILPSQLAKESRHDLAPKQQQQ